MRRYRKFLLCICISSILSVSFCQGIYASEPVEIADSKESLDGAIDVYCPTDYPFFLFDAESGGRQLTSQIFHIANFSGEDIILDLSDAHMESKEGIDCRFLSHPIDADDRSDTKDIFAFLKVVKADSDKVFTKDELKKIDIPMKKVAPGKKDYILTGDKKPDSYEVVLKAANLDENGKFLSFNPESVFSFYIAGSATPDKSINWKNGDIKFSVNIKFRWSSEEDGAGIAGSDEQKTPEESQALPDSIKEESQPLPDDIEDTSRPDDAESSSDDELSESPKEDEGVSESPENDEDLSTMSKEESSKP